MKQYKPKEIKKMARNKSLSQTESQFARVKNALAQRTPNPSVGLSSLSNMGGANGRIANLYARATSAYMKRKQAALGAVSG
jgi:hypothetical protein|nr:MAG TPA: hypothetical protein [Caudoviricetes sp.]